MTAIIIKKMRGKQNGGEKHSSTTILEYAATTKKN